MQYTNNQSYHSYENTKKSSISSSSHRKQQQQQQHSYTEDSGGVINFHTSSSQRRIEYSNRIRNCGLGGFEYYDFMFMSTNERFIAVNTKTGNLMTRNDNDNMDTDDDHNDENGEDGNVEEVRVLRRRQHHHGPESLCCEGLFMIDLEQGS